MNTIRLYAAADLHGRQTCMDIVARQASRSEIQAVVLAGDLVHYHRGHAIMDRLAALPKPVYAVRGNTDPRRAERRMAASCGFHSLDFKRGQLHALPLVGISGTLPIPFCSRIGWFEAQHLDRLAAQIDSRTILVAHPPPWGIRDRVAGRWHAGSRGLRRLVEKVSPAVLICGHIHEAAGIEKLGRTLVVNCALGKRGQGAIISYDGKRDPTARML